MKTETLELTRVFHKTQGNAKIFDFLTNLTLEEVIDRNQWLKESDRKITGTRKENITINNNKMCEEYFENGILKCYWLDANPNDDELMKIKPSEHADAEGNEASANFLKSIGQ